MQTRARTVRLATVASASPGSWPSWPRPARTHRSPCPDELFSPGGGTGRAPLEPEVPSVDKDRRPHGRRACCQVFLPSFPPCSCPTLCFRPSSEACLKHLPRESLTYCVLAALPPGTVSLRPRFNKDWCMIASVVPGRTARQCRERYKNHIKTGNKGDFHPTAAPSASATHLPRVTN